MEHVSKKYRDVNIQVFVQSHNHYLINENMELGDPNDSIWMNLSYGQEEVKYLMTDSPL